MEPEEKTPPDTADQPDTQPPEQESAAPSDALSRTPEDLDSEQAERAAASGDVTKAEQPNEKKISPIKKFFRRINIYLLFFLLLVVIVSIIAAVTYLNSKKVPPEIAIASQELTDDALKQLSNTDVSVGNSSQTLSIQGNAVISGQTLMRGNLNVAGNIQAGGSLKAPSLTIAGDSNLGSTQANSLQVATNAAVQGSTTLRDLTVAGSANFSGPLKASQITVTRLVLSGNAVLKVPNHVSFTGPSPSRTINHSVLGRGGSASVNGSDTAGTVNINTGSGPVAGCFTRINFHQAAPSRPHVIISPVGSAAGKTKYYVTRDTGGFSVCTSSPAPANQSFSFDYFVTT